MKGNFNQQLYEQLGGEKDSLQRYQKYCEVLKAGRANPVQMKMEMLTHRPSFTNDELKLGNAEINLAAKDCK
jgi:hypothetical protein